MHHYCSRSVPHFWSFIPRRSKHRRTAPHRCFSEKYCNCLCAKFRSCLFFAFSYARIVQQEKSMKQQGAHLFKLPFEFGLPHLFSPHESNSKGLLNTAPPKCTSTICCATETKGDSYNAMPHALPNRIFGAILSQKANLNFSRLT